MPSFKQKNIIKRYKLRLQEKLKTVTEETEKSISFLNNCLFEFSNRVQHILEIKDEKCLSLYRKLISDLESYSEKLFILQASLEEASEEETDSGENDESESRPLSGHSNSATLESLPAADQSNSVNCLSSHASSHVLSGSHLSVKSGLDSTNEGATCSLQTAKSKLEECYDCCNYTEKDINSVNFLPSHASSHVLSGSHFSVKSELESSNKSATYSLQAAKSKLEEYHDSLNYSERHIKSVNDDYSEGASFLQDTKSKLDDYCVGASYIEKNVKTKLEDYYEGTGSTTEDDFCSIHSDGTAQNIASAAFLLNSQPSKRKKESNYEHCDSNQSLSQSSCYRSLSSNFSEPLVLYNETVKSTQSSRTHSTATENKTKLELEPVHEIHPPDIRVPSAISVTLTHIVDPGDFWIQIENSGTTNIRFSKSEYCHLSCLSFIRKYDYCLAPFKSSPFFYRGKSLSNAKSGEEKVKIHLIDHGSTQEIPLCDLRSLPLSAYAVPTQALHCYLHGVAPIGGIWSAECTDKFKDFQDSHSIETIIKSKENLYAVQLTAHSSEDFHEDFSVDVGLYLCLEGLAISENDSISLSMELNHCLETQQSEPASANVNSVEVSDMTAISNDSGVSVTSVYKSNQNCSNTKENSDKVENILKRGLHQISTIPIINSSTDSFDKKFGFSYDSQAQDLISFESSNILHFKNFEGNTKFIDRSSKSICIICKRHDFCLHLKIPPPRLVFVEKDMMIVMLSHVVTPHQFYVNMAMENIVNLDELREQMTSIYESERNNFPPIRRDDLEENMFCAGYYDVDGYWYRVKVTGLNLRNKEEGIVTVQYIDYGNTATISCSNLQPLMPQFSQHPPFAIKCSLAGTIPIEDIQVAARSAFLPIWNEDAISTFKQITSFDRCLTAEICSELLRENNDALPVLLWDTEESDDRLLNLVLADLGVAKFDYKRSSVCLSTEHTTDTCVNISSPSNNAGILNAWDPMSEEYHDIENNYSVDAEDIQVLTSGYQARDEEYTCKYFSLRGFCPRGAGCPYEHHALLENSVTRDQEEVYCLDTSPILPDTTDNTIVNVSAIINPNHFYVILPYGCKTINEINSLINSGSTAEDILNNDARALFYAMNKHYSNASYQENTSVALACGTIVAARRNWDKQWHRGRVVDVSDINGPAKVFFVDSGDSEWVQRKFIRTILREYLYTPFQAVQCSLSGVAPFGSEDTRWQSHAVKYFKKVVEGESLLAESIQRFGQVFHLRLRRTNENNHKYIGKLLVSAGLAQFCADVPSQQKEARYVPG